MKKIFKIILFLLAILFVVANKNLAQLSLEANYGTTIYYKSDTSKKDTLFVFHSTLNNEITTIQSKLSANHSSGDTSVFKWYKYNEQTFSFDSLAPDDSNIVTSVLDSIILPGCYRVEVTDTSDSVEIHTCWVHIDYFEAFIYRDPAQKNQEQFICDEIWLKPYYEHAHFYYYDIYDTIPKIDSVLNDTNDFNISMHSDLKPNPVPADKKNPIISPVPIKTDIFYFDIKNAFENLVSCNVIYDSVWVPSFEENEGVKLTHSAENVPDMEKEYYAPDDVTFDVHAENYDSIMWIFGDTLTPGFKDDSTYIAYNLFQNNHLYIRPDTINVTIKIKNTKYGCDTSYSEEFILVSSKIDSIPNVFTPNTDKYNNYWIVRGASIKYYKVAIFNRWGDKIYEEEKDNNTERDFFKWDGTMNNNGGREAPTGIYFYKIEAIGWDGLPYEYEKPEGESFFEKIFSGYNEDPPPPPPPDEENKQRYIGYFYLLRERR